MAVQEFTWHDENDRMIGTDADIIDIDVALRGSADDYLRLIKRKQLCDDTVNQLCQLGHKHSVLLDLRQLLTGDIWP